MAIPRAIKQYLFHNGISYNHKTHAVAYTAQEIAEADHVKGGEFAKSVVLKADGQFVLAVLSADRMINLDALKRQLGCRTLEFVPESEFAASFAHCQPGAMPPFGRLFAMPLYCDEALARQAEIEFNAGTHLDTVRIHFLSFRALENPTVLDFSEPRINRNRVA